MTAQMREKLGRDNIRVAQTHSKFALFQNADWKVCLRTSMNLNMNPRTRITWLRTIRNSPGS